jgi:hypothetical protein
LCAQIIGSAGISSGQVIFEESNDNTTFVPMVVYDNSLITAIPIIAAFSVAASTNKWYSGKINCRYVRCRISTVFAGGTIQALTRFNVTDYIPRIQTVGQNTAANHLVTATLSANTPVLAAGANLAGDFGVEYRANATGAATPSSILSPATPAGASIKGSPGRILAINLQNSAASFRSVKFFNQTSVTMGTTSATFEMDIPAGGNVQFVQEGGIAFGTGIMWAVTSGKGLTDNTSTGLVANDVSGVVTYA